MSSIPANKQELHNAITQAYRLLRVDYDSIPADHARIVGVQGNVKDTEITICDTVAYLIGWQKLVLKWHQRQSLGQPVDLPETGYQWNELGKLAQAFQHQYRDWSYESLLNEFDHGIEQILALVDSLSDQQLYGEAWYKQYPFGRMIQFNTSSPMKNIRAKVRRFKKSQKL